MITFFGIWAFFWAALPFITLYLFQERDWQGESAWLDMQQWNREQAVRTGTFLTLDTAERPAIRRAA